MKAVYEATYAIEELGVRVGDTIVVEPGHPDEPLLIVRGFDRNQLPTILDHLDRLTLTSFDGPVSSSAPSSIRSWLRAREKRERPLRLVR